MWRSWIMWAAWPAFMAACVLEIGVFAFVDPQDLHGLSSMLDLSHMGVYTATFFFFWLVSLGSGCLTLMLAQPWVAPTTDTPGD